MDNVRNKEDEGSSQPVSESGSEIIVNTEELVIQAIRGNSGAFGKLYIVFVEKIYRYVYYSTQSKDTSEDITQEVFLKAWSAIDSCRGREKTFSSWLFRIAHNLLIDRLRKYNRRVSFEIQPMEDKIDTSSGLEMKFEQQDLMKAMDYLPENQRRVIILKFIEGMDNREIADILSKSEGAVRILQMRALDNLKKELDKE
jgi:RNA polymerase sigma-70 factor, ECF subfamily